MLFPLVPRRLSVLSPLRLTPAPRLARSTTIEPSRVESHQRPRRKCFVTVTARCCLDTSSVFFSPVKPAIVPRRGSSCQRTSDRRTAEYSVSAYRTRRLRVVRSRKSDGNYRCAVSVCEKFSVFSRQCVIVSPTERVACVYIRARIAGPGLSLPMDGLPFFHSLVNSRQFVATFVVRSGKRLQQATRCQTRGDSIGQRLPSLESTISGRGEKLFLPPALLDRRPVTVIGRNRDRNRALFPSVRSSSRRD